MHIAWDGVYWKKSDNMLIWNTLKWYWPCDVMFRRLRTHYTHTNRGIHPRNTKHIHTSTMNYYYYQLRSVRWFWSTPPPTRHLRWENGNLAHKLHTWTGGDLVTIVCFSDLSQRNSPCTLLAGETNIIFASVPDQASFKTMFIGSHVTTMSIR